MTEELTPEFLEFSQMLDDEFETESADFSEELSVLLELREALKDEQTGLMLESNFSTTTAEQVEARYEALPWVHRLWEDRSLLLMRPAFAKSSLKVSGGLIASALLFGFLDFRLLGLLAVALGLLAAGSIADEIFLWSGKQAVSYGELRLQRPIFFLLPLVTIVLAGMNIGASMSPSGVKFQFYTSIGLLGGVLAFVPIFKFLERLRSHFRSQKRILIYTQITFAILGLALSYGLLAMVGYASNLMAGLSRFFEQDLVSFEAWSVFLVWFVSCALVISLCHYLPEERLPALRYRLGEGLRLAWLGDMFFYFLPVSAVLLSGAFLGGLLHGLGEVSLTFKDDNTAIYLALLGGCGISFLLYGALKDLWTAIRKRAKTNPALLVGSQALHAIWLISVLSSVMAIVGDPTAQIHLWRVVCIFLIFIGSAGCYLCTPSYPTQPDLKAARKRFRNTIIFSSVPLVLSLYGFYQLHLTREIHDKSGYNNVKNQVGDWIDSRIALTSEDNGWFDMQPYLTNSGSLEEFTEGREDRKNLISDFAAYEMGAENNYLAAIAKDPELYKKNKARFLSLLPIIRRALAKPNYSYITKRFKSEFDSIRPNYIRDRQVAQSFGILKQDAMVNEDWDDFLEYAELGLAWGDKGESESLMDLMIQVAMSSIAHTNLEEVVVEGNLDSKQLQRLAEALEKATPHPGVLRVAMERETALVDRFFQRLTESTGEALKEINYAGFSPLLVYAPKSYWESERKAYWNHQLRRRTFWTQLTFQDDEFLDINPLNVTAATILPNTSRAGAQFCYLHSKFSAMVIVCELERYKLNEGHYPKKLSELVPDYLNQVPKDMMSVHVLSLKDPFEYRTTEEGYLLISTSPGYHKLGAESPQVYGHDGRYGEHR